MRLTMALMMGALLVVAQDEDAATSAVKAEFMGASGKMKLSKTGEDGFLMVSQAKLEEVGANGKKCTQCTSLTVAGQNSWTPLKETKTDDVTTMYSTTFKVAKAGVDFSLTAHLAVTTSEVDEEVPCSGCSEGEGSCKATDDKCQASTDGVCAANTTMCTETVTVTEDQLKFSFVVTGFVFKDQANKFSYALEFQDKSGVKGKAEGGKVEMGDGYLDIPTEGKVKGGSADKTVTADITYEFPANGQKTVINFKFDSWGVGESLYYDPTMALGSADSPQYSAGSLLSAAGVAGFTLLVTALLPSVM